MISDKQTETKWQTLVLSVIVLGVITGLSSVFLSLLLDVVERLFLDFEEYTFLPVATGVSPLHRFISVSIGGIVAAIIWFTIQKKMAPVVGINKALNGEKMPFVAMAIHVMTQIFYVATGGSIGRELAPREAGALLAQKWEGFISRFGWGTLSAEDKKLLMAAAAGAGFAGIYIAPITGMLFAVEILLKKVDKRTVAVALGMSVIAMLVGSIIKGFHPYYSIPNIHFDIMMAPFALVAGPLFAVAGAYFRQAFQWAEKNRATGKTVLWQLSLVGLLTGVVAAYYPQIMGNGRGLAELAFNSSSNTMVGYLVSGMLLKAIVTTVTIKGGAFGGTLTPSIAIGSAMGVLLGFLYVLIVPGASIAQAGLIGAVTLLAASQQAPLMAMFMLFEVSHLDFSAFLPLGIGVASAMLFSKFVLKK